MMMMQNAQMHQMIMQQLMLSALPKNPSPSGREPTIPVSLATELMNVSQDPNVLFMTCKRDIVSNLWAYLFENSSLYIQNHVLLIYQLLMLFHRDNSWQSLCGLAL